MARGADEKFSHTRTNTDDRDVKLAAAEQLCSRRKKYSVHTLFSKATKILLFSEFFFRN